MNFGEIIEAVRLRCGISVDDTRMTAFIKSAINEEYARIATENRMLQKTGTLSLVADSEVVDLPNDWQMTEQIRTATYVLTPLTPLGYAKHKAAGYDGPYVYTGVSPERINILPVPTESEPQGLTISYVAKPEALVDDTDEPYVIQNGYRNVLSAIASYHVLIAEEASELAQIAQAEGAAVEARISAIAQQNKGGGPSKIIPPPATVH